MRIKAICSQITKPNCIIADVGSDHAFLSINLLQNGKAKHVYNIEKNTGPLNNGIKNLTEKGLVSKTTNIQNDGLRNVELPYLDYCVIAGMGGFNIASILEENDSVKVGEFILLPNNSIYHLRKYLMWHRYKITYEEVIRDGKFFYVLIKCRKTLFINPMCRKKLTFGPYLLSSKNELLYYELKERLEHILETGAYKHSEKIMRELKAIRKIIKKYENR